MNQDVSLDGLMQRSAKCFITAMKLLHLPGRSSLMQVRHSSQMSSPRTSDRLKRRMMMIKKPSAATMSTMAFSFAADGSRLFFSFLQTQLSSGMQLGFFSPLEGAAEDGMWKRGFAFAQQTCAEPARVTWRADVTAFFGGFWSHFL